jgi:cathepsin D
MLSLLLVAIALLPFTLAARQLDGGVVHTPIMRRSHFNRVANLPKTVEALRRKYGHQVTNVKSTKSKRASTAAIPMTCEVCISIPRAAHEIDHNCIRKMISLTQAL